MKKFSIALATIATLAVAAPAVSSAQEIGVRIGGDRDAYRDRGDFRTHEFRGARAEYRGVKENYGWHRGWDRDRGSDRVVVIKKHRHYDWD